MKISPFFSSFFLVIIQFSGVLSKGYIEECDCSSKMSIDQALIKYSTLQNDTSLYIKNSRCYKCSKVYVGDNNQCALFFTPHSFRLYIVNTQNNSIIYTKRDYKFGEHGIYTVSYNSNTIEIFEEKEPIDTYKPLQSLVIVIIVITFFVFLPSIRKIFPSCSCSSSPSCFSSSSFPSFSSICCIAVLFLFE